MAHADYDCCAVCDSKQSYSCEAKAKQEICSYCVAELAVRGVIVHNVDELMRWMENNASEKVLAMLTDVGFSLCCYGNPIDDLAKAIGFVEKGDQDG